MERKLYTSSRYKLDEHHATKTYFNLEYNGGIFSGLYSLDRNQNVPEHYPLGTAVQIPLNTGSKQGYVIAVPAANQSPDTDPYYSIQLLEGAVTTVPTSAMYVLVDTTTTTVGLQLLTWIYQDAKV